MGGDPLALTSLLTFGRATVWLCCWVQIPALMRVVVFTPDGAHERLAWIVGMRPAFTFVCTFILYLRIVSGTHLEPPEGNCAGPRGEDTKARDTA